MNFNAKLIKLLNIANQFNFFLEFQKSKIFATISQQFKIFLMNQIQSSVENKSNGNCLAFLCFCRKLCLNGCLYKLQPAYQCNR